MYEKHGMIETYYDEYSSYAVDRRHDLLRYRWLETSRQMSEEEFRNDLLHLAKLVEREHCANVLVDVREFFHESPRDFWQWREKNVIPKYNAAGIRKFAFLVSKEAKSTVEKGAIPETEGSAKFPTGYFSSTDDALDWFDGRLKL